MHNLLQQITHNHNVNTCTEHKSTKSPNNLNCSGYNLDLHNGEEDGNKVTPKSPGTFIVIIQQKRKLVPENPKTNKYKNASPMVMPVYTCSRK
jgi:hypothetical protein